MRIVSWNCSGALRKKYKALEALQADLLIIQECENPAYPVEYYQDYREWAGECGRDYLWKGDSPWKGLGIFSRTGLPLHSLPWHGEFTFLPIKPSRNVIYDITYCSDDLKLFQPFAIGSYNILGIWAKSNLDDISFQYAGQVWKYLQIHKQDLNREKTLLIGDFKGNAASDKKHGLYGIAAIVSDLESIGIESLYHKQYNEAYGEESRPTFYCKCMRMVTENHVDYAFCSQDLIEKTRLELGKTKDWLKISDHLSLIVDIAD